MRRGPAAGVLGCRGGLGVLLLIGLMVLGVPCRGAAGDRYALIITGANGEDSYGPQYAEWRQKTSLALIEKLGFDARKVSALFEGGDADHLSTAAGVRKAIDGLKARMKPDDLLLLVLIGHGSFDGTEAKFNLVGPDLSAAEWAALLKPLPGTLVFVDATAASFPFLEHLAAPHRIVITATDSVAQRFDTVFPEYFIKALTDPEADIDKNGRVSVWEAFNAASVGVRRYFTQRGQLATERALMDDNGDGIGRESGGEGNDGTAAARLYLDPDVPGAAPTDEVLLTLLQKRAAIQVDLDDLKERRQLLTPPDYQAEFERLMIEMAKVSRDIRARQKVGS
jgi:hypothetical protein